MSAAVLSCTELLGLICQDCDCNTLTQLSVASRQISYSALDVLWSSIENLGPLIRCMPNDLWEEHTLAGTRFLSFRRPIRKTDWKRFLLNSARVQKIGYSAGSITYEVESNTYRMLFRAVADDNNMKLLPRVQELDTRLLFTDVNELSSYIPFLLSSTITGLIIDLSTKPHRAMIPILIDQCPFVNEAVLVGSERNQDGEVDFCNVVALMRQWSHLQSLSVRAIHPMAVLALSSLPSLKALGVGRIESNKDRSLPSPPSTSTTSPNLGFPHLEHLIIDDYTSPNFISQLIYHMHQTPLTSLEVHFYDRTPYDLFLDFLNATARSVHPEHLQSIALYFEGGTKFMDPLSTQSMAPLLSFTHLKFVHFTNLTGFNFDDDTVDAMAYSWKDLEKLGVESFWQPLPRTTWKSLVSLAKHNPRLEELTLPFDATTITAQLFFDPGSIPWRDIRNGVLLRMLDVCRSPIDCPSVVARFISNIFPNLEKISFTPNLIPTDQTDSYRCVKWAEVEKLLRTMRD